MPRPHRPARLSRRAALLAFGLCVAAVGSAGPSAAVVAPRADYQLQRTLTTSVGVAPALTNVGTANSFITTTVDGTPGRVVLRYPIGGGLALTPALSTVKAASYTVVVLYKPLDTTGPYHRILDLNGGSGDTGLYERAGALSAYPNAGSTTTPISSTAFSQVVLTRYGGSKLVTGYVNGQKVLSFTDAGDAWLATDLVRFGKDNTSNGAVGEETGGQFARIRMYDAPLPASDVMALDRLPATTADLALTYVDAPDPVLAGAFLAYTATVSNNGPAVAAGVTVRLSLPTGAVFQGSSPSRGTCAAPSGGAVLCSLGSLAVGTSSQVLLVLKAPPGTGPISSTATTAATTPDTTPGSATQGTTVR